MIRIEMSPYDQKDILELLDLSLEFIKYDKYGRWKWTSAGYWKHRIPQLKQVMSGRDGTPPIYRSSLGGYSGADYQERDNGELDKYN